MLKRGLSMFGLVAAIALVGCASEDWQSKYEEQQKLNLDLSAQNDLAVQQRAEAAAKAEQYAAQLRQTDVEAQKARQAAEAAAKQNEQLRGQLATTSTAPKSAPATGVDMKAMQALVDELKRDLGKSAGEIGLTKDGNIEITLASDVNFGAGSAELSEAGKKSLRALSPLLKGKFAPYQVRVEGHTDATPLAKTRTKFNDNFGLGSARDRKSVV